MNAYLVRLDYRRFLALSPFLESCSYLRSSSFLPRVRGRSAGSYPVLMISSFRSQLIRFAETEGSETCFFFLVAHISGAMILVTSRSDNKLSPHCLRARTLTQQYCNLLYSQLFIDQVCSVKMAGCWHGQVLFLRVHGPRLRLGPQTRKKRTWPISSHLDLALGQYNPHIMSRSNVTHIVTSGQQLQQVAQTFTTTIVTQLSA